MSKFCIKCGIPLPDEAVFCTKCGSPQPSVQGSSPAQKTPPRKQSSQPLPPAQAKAAQKAKQPVPPAQAAWEPKKQRVSCFKSLSDDLAAMERIGELAGRLTWLARHTYL